METHASPQTAPEAVQLQALVRNCRRLAAEPDPARALWELVCALRDDLAIDRAGIFFHNRPAGILERVVGIDAHGRPEYGGQAYAMKDSQSPMMRVAMRRIPYYFSDDAPRDFPDVTFAPGVRAHAIIPMIAGDELLGTLCVDNCLSHRAMPERVLEPLFLYAGMAALPLFTLYQRQEAQRTEAVRREVSRAVLLSVTRGKILLCEEHEIEEEWPALGSSIAIRLPEDVRALRDQVRSAGQEAGMEAPRLDDMGLCASEAATNALVHGRGGVASVGSADGRLRVRVSDQGAGIDPEDLSRAVLQDGWSKKATMGLGFTLIHKTADRLLLHTGPTGTTVIIEMAVEPHVNLPEGSNPLLWGDEWSV